MADYETNNQYGFVSRSRLANNKIPPAFATPPVSISDMRTRLAAINAGYYTTAMLNTLTRNDMMYALRLADAPTSI